MKNDIIAAFRNFLGKLDQFPNLQPTERDSARVRILSAIKFFGDQLSEEEESFLVTFNGTQADTLANKGFLLPKGEIR